MKSPGISGAFLLSAVPGRPVGAGCGSGATMLQYVEPVFRPPSEARSLILQITVGCSHNRCAFCGMYKMKRFRLKPLAEIFAELAGLPPRWCVTVDRVFLADGDALVYPFAELCLILDRLAAYFPALTRVGSYASPNSLTTKGPEQLALLREKKLRILYLGLESGDERTLAAIGKGFTAGELAGEALKARQAGMKLSVTAILGLAGRSRSLEHARATAAWVSRVAPEYFSLLTLFQRHNEQFIGSLEQCTRRQLLMEARELLTALNPVRTILRSNHVSNFLSLAGNYPRDRQRLIQQVDQTLAAMERLPGYLDSIPGYEEAYY